jgi:hypothetical protein
VEVADHAGADDSEFHGFGVKERGFPCGSGLYDKVPVKLAAIRKAGDDKLVEKRLP